MVICLERGADLHTAQLMPLPLTVSSFSKIQIGFTFLVPAHPGSPGQRVCVCVFQFVVNKSTTNRSNGVRALNSSSSSCMAALAYVNSACHTARSRRPTVIGVNDTGDAGDTSPAIFGQRGTKCLISPAKSVKFLLQSHAKRHGS